MLRTRKVIATVTATAALCGGMALPAQAQPQQNGLVNVFVGDSLIEDSLNIAAAVDVVANVCGVQIPVNVLAAAAARNRTVCTADGQAVTLQRVR